jgi:hypothetical protein
LSLLSGRQQRRTRLSEPDPEATERTSGGLLRFITQPKQQEPHLFWLAVTGATRLATDASFLPVEPKSPPHFLSLQTAFLFCHKSVHRETSLSMFVPLPHNNPLAQQRLSGFYA